CGTRSVFAAPPERCRVAGRQKVAGTAAIGARLRFFPVLLRHHGGSFRRVVRFPGGSPRREGPEAVGRERLPTGDLKPNRPGVGELWAGAQGEAFDRPRRPRATSNRSE